MTTPSEDSVVVYTGAGTVGPFTIPFIFLADTHIKAIRTTIADGVELALALTTDYTLTGEGDPNGGELTLVTALSSAYKLTIYRDPDALQGTDLSPHDSFPADVVERMVDKVTQLIQRFKNLFTAKVLRHSDGDISGINNVLPTPVASGFLRVKSDLSGYEYALDPGLLSVSAFVQTLIDDANADAFLDTLIAGLSEEATLAFVDRLLVWDQSVGQWKWAQLGNLQKPVNVATASQITVNQNDYNPTGLSTTSILRVSSDARRNVTGLAGGVLGAQKTLQNVGTQPIVLKYEDAASTAANRFAFGLTLGGGQSIEIWYDANSSRWRLKGTHVPIGTILPFGGGTVPEGYLARDGANVSRTTYASLFNEVGTTWGVGDGATTFGVGDDRRRSWMGSGGAGTGTVGNAVGNVGGAEDHTLTAAQIPAHPHPSADGNGFTTTGGGGAGVGFTSPGTDNQRNSGGNTGNNTGGGGAHNTIHPVAVVTSMIKAL